MIREPVEPTDPADPSLPPTGDDNPYAPPRAPLPAPPGSSVHPWIFGILMIPFGVASGYVSGTMGSLLESGGVSKDQISELIALGVLPHTFKFFWSPVVDVTLNAKSWYIFSTALTAIAVALLGAFPATDGSMGTLRLLVFLGGLSTTVVGMAADILMAHSTPPDQRGRAGGWFQAGNVGGASVGGGIGLLIATRVPYYWIASGIVGLLCALCCLALLRMPSPPHAPRTRRIRDLIVDTLRDAWHVAKVPRGQLALLLCAVPLGLAVSSGLWSAMASEWSTDSDTVAIVSGILGGVVSSVGCLAGGWCCERWDRQRCYVVFGILVAILGAAMAWLPHTKGMFVSLALLISFCAGMSWAAYTAFVLDVIGVGGAATKFSAFASLANLPIWYMGHVNGWALKTWNTDAMLYLEAALGIASAGIFLIAVKLFLRRAQSTEIPAVP